MKLWMAFLLTTLTFLSSFTSQAASEGHIALGERLFNETRFTRNFWHFSNGDVNAQEVPGEEHLETLEVSKTQEVDSPFRGQSTSCASCHLVDQAFDISGAGMRTYTDFSERPKISKHLTDKKVRATRNTTTLVGMGSKYNKHRISHFDGEFDDHQGTVMGNLLGRNMGWSATQKPYAIKNLIRVIKQDNGQGDLAQDFGGSYTRIWKSTDPDLSAGFKLNKSEQLDVHKASDDEILKAVTSAVVAYMNDLDFQTNEKGQYNGSTFDQFLLVNGFSTIPKQGEAPEKYTQRLRQFLGELKNPTFIKNHELPSHRKSFNFSHKQWLGAKIFFDVENQLGAKGRCFKCHTAPLYTDQNFHNVGTSQIEYDSLHGFGQFLQLYIPGNDSERKERLLNQRPQKDRPGLVDLGAWNFYQRKNGVTEFLREQVCKNLPSQKACPLPLMVARFKTASLRNLRHSAPYFHHGKREGIKDVLRHYTQAQALAKHALLRNGAQELREMSFNHEEFDELESFLESLNEHYD
jgi:cytochrome c peroxidase